MDVNGSPVCIDVALYLINRGCGSVEDKTKLLCAACRWGNLGAVKELVEEHKVDFSGKTCTSARIDRAHLFQDNYATWKK